MKTVHRAALAALLLTSLVPSASAAAPDGLLLGSSTVGENLPPGTVVGTLAVLDADPGDTHTFLMVENPGDRFAVDLTTGVVTTLVTLDFEDDAQHSIRIRATDSTSLWIERTFTITVLDRNDAPTGVSLSVIGVPEDAQLDALVGTFRAVGDADQGDAWTYVLLDDSDGRFALEGDRLRVAAPLDHETEPLAIIEVSATDIAGASASAIFVLDIWDRNEAPLGVALNGSPILETATPGTSAGTLTALGDPDVGDAWTFELRSSGVPFVVSGNGLVLTSALDFEAKASWTMTIRVTDRGGKAVETSVVVFVGDVNEAPTGVTLVGSGVTENAAAGAVAGTLSATDPDANDSHTFAIVDGDGFTLVGASVVTTMSFDYETTPTRVLVVSATDEADHTVMANVTIPVVNVDEPPLSIQLSGNTVNENAPQNSLVGFLSVVDPDGGTVQFALVNDGNGAFRVENTTLRIAANLDFEATPTRDIVVRALTPSGAYIDQPFTITILDVDESATGVVLDATAVRENQPAGTVVGNLSPSGDPDDSSGYVYTLLQNPGSYLTIVDDELRTTGPLDFETTRNLNVRIRATSPAGVSVESQVEITVLDEPEAPTALIVSGAVVQEAREPGVFVATLFAQGDPDQGDSHVFTLVENPDNAFAISSSTLSAAKRLDYEARDSYPLVIRATDEAGLTIEAAITVHVLDVNEPPTGVALAPRTFPENLALPGVIGTLSAVGDPDADERHTFSLTQNPEDRFDVIGDTLLLRKAVDFESEEQSFRIQVNVRDAGNLQAEGVFFVDVTDVNEVPGALTLETRSVSENAFAGTVVGSIGGGVDPDANDTRTLTIVADPGNAFAVDAERRLVTTRTLDHEDRSALTVTVRQTDSGGLFVEGTWTIDVVDVNEPPTNIVLDVSTIPESAGVDWIVGYVTAIGDPDDGSSFTYTLVDDAEGLFVMDGDALRLAGTLDFETAGAHTVWVRATDNGGLSIEREFLVKVIDENDPPTLGVETLALPDVVEDDDDPQGITTEELFTALAVTDVDTSANVVLHVAALDDADGAWLVDDAPVLVDTLITRGESRLRFVPEPNFNGTVTLTVSADDGYVRSAPALLSLAVTAVNDAPTIDAAELVEARENAPAALPVVIADIDADEVLVLIEGVDIVIPEDLAELEGTPAEVTELLAELEITPADGFVGEGSVTISVNDLGGTGAGGPKTVSHSVRVEVTAAPDLRLSRNGRELVPDDDEAIGSLGVGAWTIIWLDLENHGSQELALTEEVEVDNALLVVRPATRLAPDATTRLALAIRPLATGRHEATLRLTSTDVYPNVFEITFSGNAVLVGDLQVTDADRPVWSGLRHEIVDMRPGRAQLVTFTLDNVGLARLELIEAELERAVNCEVSVVPPFPLLDPAAPEVLEVYVTPTAAGEVRARVVLETNDPDAEHFVFELVGVASTQGSPRPVLGRLPGVLIGDGGTDDLGTATSGDEVALAYRLTNLGSVALDPTTLLVEEASNAIADVVADLPESLAPGESVALVVFVTPTSAGPFSVTLGLRDTTWTLSGEADATGADTLRLHPFGSMEVLVDTADIGPLALATPRTVGFVIENASGSPRVLDLPIAVDASVLVDAIAQQPEQQLARYAGAVVSLEVVAREVGPASFDLLWSSDDVLHVTSAGQVGQLVFSSAGAPVAGTTLQLALLKPGKEVGVPLELVNAGTGPLTLGEITFGGGKACGDIDLPETTVIEAETSVTVMLYVDPVVGRFECSLSVQSDDPARPTATLAITGRGAASGDGGGCGAGATSSLPGLLGASLLLITLARRRRSDLR